MCTDETSETSEKLKKLKKKKLILMNAINFNIVGYK